MSKIDFESTKKKSPSRQALSALSLSSIIQNIVKYAIERKNFLPGSADRCVNFPFTAPHSSHILCVT